MNATDATEHVADATRRALDELADLPADAELAAVVVLLEAHVPYDNDEDGTGTSTHVIWKVSPQISSTWLHGILATAAHVVRLGYQGVEDDQP